MKVTLYTIYSPTFKSYYNERFKCLDEQMNEHTKLYGSISDAMRKIEGIINEVYDAPYNMLCTELAWNYLENKYHVSRWHLDVGHDEFKVTEELFKDLQIKAVVLDVQA